MRTGESEGVKREEAAEHGDKSGEVLTPSGLYGAVGWRGASWGGGAGECRSRARRREATCCGAEGKRNAINKGTWSAYIPSLRRRRQMAYDHRRWHRPTALAAVAAAEFAGAAIAETAEIAVAAAGLEDLRDDAGESPR